MVLIVVHARDHVRAGELGVRHDEVFRKPVVPNHAAAGIGGLNRKAGIAGERHRNRI